MPGSILQLDLQSDDGTVVIRCDGEIDVSVVGELREAIQWSYTPALSVLRVDMIGVSFIDSSGLGCLLESMRDCEARGATFEVVPSPAVARLFELTGMFDLAESGALTLKVVVEDGSPPKC